MTKHEEEITKSSLQQDNKQHGRTSTKQTYNIVGIGCIILLIITCIVFVSVYCGTGYCSSNSSRSSNGSLNNMSSSSSSSATNGGNSTKPGISGTGTYNSTESDDQIDDINSNNINNTNNETVVIDKTTKEYIFTTYVNSITFVTNRTIRPVPDAATIGKHNNNTSNNVMVHAEDRALYWMIYRDPIFVNVTTSNTSTSSNSTKIYSIASFITSNTSTTSTKMTIAQIRFQQRYSLLTLWFQQEITGIKWNRTTNWMWGHECQWFGITCTTIDFSNSTLDSWKHLNPLNVVTGLDFYVDSTTNNISGTISPDLGLLSHLTKIDFKYNEIHGTIPSAVGTWTNLQQFEIGGNTFMSGTLPSTIGSWTNLTYFQTSSTPISGSMPDIVYTNWTNIVSFSTFNGSYTGTIPESIGLWTKLEGYAIDHNYHNGTIPQSVGLLTKMRYFLMSHNQFTGTIPESIGRWLIPTEVWFDNNNLSGTIPTTIWDIWFDISFPEYIQFHNNSLLRGTIPSNVCDNVFITSIVLDVNQSINCSCCVYW